MLGSSRRYWTRERVIERFHDWEKLYGRRPSPGDWRANKTKSGNGHRRWPDVSGTVALFGSWSAALEAAGYKPNDIVPRKAKTFRSAKPKKKAVAEKKVARKIWTADEVIQLMQEWEGEHVFAPGQWEWRKSKGYPSPETVARIFGSWNEAVTAAGIRPRPQGLRTIDVKRLMPLPRNR